MKKVKQVCAWLLVLMLSVSGIGVCPTEISAASTYDSYSSVSSTMASTIYNLISKQSFSLIVTQTAYDYTDYFFYRSSWKVGNNFPYSNNGTMAGTISDGTYTYTVNSWGCYAYAKFAQMAYYQGQAEKSTDRLYSDSSSVTADGIKNLLRQNGQAGEHLRIDGTHSLLYLASDDNGFYALSYEGGPIRLVYFKWTNFAQKYSGKRVWLYNVDKSTNNLSSTTTSTTNTTSDYATVSNGTYTLTPKCAQDKRLDLANCSSASGANIQIYENNNSAAQKFTLTSRGSGYYSISTSISGMVIEVSGGKAAGGTNIAQGSYSGASKQLWMLKDAGDGYYYIYSALDGGTKWVLDVANAGTTNGTNVQLCGLNGSNAQKWKLTTTSSTTTYQKPTITISSARSPSSIRKGRAFGLRGVIKTNYGTLTNVTGYVYYSNGNLKESYSYTPNSTSFNIKNTLNNDFIFNYYSRGTYRYVVTATAVNGDQTVTKTLINKTFRIR